MPTPLAALRSMWYRLSRSGRLPPDASWATPGAFCAFFVDHPYPSDSTDYVLHPRVRGEPMGPANYTWVARADHYRYLSSARWLTHKGISLPRSRWAAAIGLHPSGLSMLVNKFQSPAKGLEHILSVYADTPEKQATVKARIAAEVAARDAAIPQTLIPRDYVPDATY